MYIRSGLFITYNLARDLIDEVTTRNGTFFSGSLYYYKVFELALNASSNLIYCLCDGCLIHTLKILDFVDGFNNWRSLAFDYQNIINPFPLKVFPKILVQFFEDSRNSTILLLIQCNFRVPWFFLFRVMTG